MVLPTDSEPVFCTATDSVQSRWSLIREFTRRWQRIDVSAVAKYSDFTASEQRRFTVDLPASIVEFISYADDLTTLDSFDIMRDCYEMSHLVNHRAISLLMQGECDRHWAVLHNELTFDDPPVHTYGFDYDNGRDDRFVYQGQAWNSVSSFALGHQAFFLHSRGGGYRTGATLTDSQLLRTQRSFDVCCDFSGIRIFEKRNLIVFLIPAASIPNAYQMIVEVSSPMPKSRLPRFVTKHAADATSRHGMFAE